MKYQLRTTRLTLAQVGEAIFSEMATQVEIDDEGGGEYVMVRQQNEALENGEIAIDPDEWPMLKEAIEQMLANCREEKNEW